MSFYDDMQKKLGGGGDFALGYVLAHEVGHHVQTVLGISEQVQTLQQRVTKRVTKKEANALQVKMELQADCFTHGTSLQRLNWFKKGFKSGNPNVCNTWQADKL